MLYSNEIEGCFESVFRDIGTTDKEWNLMYAHFLTAMNIRSIEKWVIVLLSEGITKEYAFHRVEQFLNDWNENP